MCVFARCIFAAKQVYKSSIIIHVHDNVIIYVTIVFDAIVRNYLSRKHLALPISIFLLMILNEKCTGSWPRLILFFEKNEDTNKNSNNSNIFFNFN